MSVNRRWPAWLQRFAREHGEDEWEQFQSPDRMRMVELSDPTCTLINALERYYRTKLGVRLTGDEVLDVALIGLANYLVYQERLPRQPPPAEA